MTATPLIHPLLGERGVRHGFGVRGWAGPEGLVRPTQVHGVAVAVADRRGSLHPGEADAVLSAAGGPSVAVVTADCVPILVAADGGAWVAAIHAGWRGLAAGVIEAAVARLAEQGASPPRLAAAIGPHAGVCCYEVDAPVRAAFEGLPPSVSAAAFRDRGPGHWMLDLSVVTKAALERSGIPANSVGGFERACTVCGGDRFESYRRDGSAAGRLVHAVTPSAAAVRRERDPS